MKLITTFKSLLTEVASLGGIQDSIEPVCIGYSKAGNLVVRAWDVDGASHTATIGEKPLPGWRLFRADKIFTYQPTTDTFSQVRPNYNPNGDKSMERVILNAKF
jgi:hypothetical protein